MDGAGRATAAAAGPRASADAASRGDRRPEARPGPVVRAKQKPSPAATGHIPLLAPVQAELTRLAEKDNWRNFLFLGEDWLVIAAAILVSHSVGFSGVTGAAAYLGAILLIGSRMRALMNLVHQGSHGQLFASRTLNDWTTRLLAAWPLGVSLEAYWDDHRIHHNLLGDRELDPKVQHYARRGLLNPPSNLPAFVGRHILLPALLRYVPANVLGAVRGHGERLMRFAMFTVAVVVAMLLGIETYFVGFWLVPFLTSFQILRYYAEMAEHSGLDQTSPWSATRNWTATLPVRWLLAPHSDHWHLVHHLQSAIPHFRLAKAHKLLMQIAPYADNGHHCDGFFFAHRPDAPSVIQDMRHPERLGDFKLTGERRKPRLLDPMLAPSAPIEITTSHATSR